MPSEPIDVQILDEPQEKARPEAKPNYRPIIGIKAANRRLAAPLMCFGVTHRGGVGCLCSECDKSATKPENIDPLRTASAKND
jgi:hypothetical protein